MKHSDSLANLAPALVKAQAGIKTIGYDSKNPFFKSQYASLTIILETIRPILAAQGLAVVQGASQPHSDDKGQITAVGVESTLLHSSGEWLSISVVMPVGVTPLEKGSDVRLPTAQNAGAAVTYGRRYALSALLALATDEDDDGNSTRPQPSAPSKPERVQPPKAASKPDAWDGTLAHAASTPFPFKGHKLSGVPLGEIAHEDLIGAHKALVKAAKPEHADLIARMDAVLADLTAQQEGK